MIFVMTPRAGKWNHRYIVPKGSVWRESDLAAIFEKSQTGDDASICAVREVHQPTTGRVGTEILVLCDERLRSRSDGEKKALTEKLTRLMKDVETLVTADIDWDREGRELVVTNEKLNEWEQSLEESLAVPPTRPPAKDGVLGPSGATHRRWSPFPVRVIMLFCAVTLLLIGGAWLAWGQLWPGVRETPSNSVGPVPFQREPKASAALKELAKIAGVDSAASRSASDLQRKVAKQLLEDLFEQEDNTGGEDGQDKLQEALTLLYGEIYRKEPPGALDELLDDGGLKEKIRLLYSPRLAGSTINPVGLLDADTAKAVDDIPAEQFVKVMKCVAHLRSIIPAAMDGGSSPNVYFVFFDKVRGSMISADVSPSGRKYLRRFYVEEDGEQIKHLKALLGSDASIRLTKSPDVSPDDNLRALLKQFGFASKVSQEQVDDRKTDYPDNPNIGRIFDALDELASACRDSVSQNETDGAGDSGKNPPLERDWPSSARE